jgi:hypothetical protein
VDGGEVRLLHGCGVARDAHRVVAQPGERVGAGPGERPHLRVATPGRLRRGEQVVAAAAGGQQDQHVTGAGVGADLAGEDVPEAVVVADRGHGGRVGVQRDRGQRTAFALEAAHELGGEVLRLGRAPAVARDEQLVAAGEPVGQRAAPPGERVACGAQCGQRRGEPVDVLVEQRATGRGHLVTHCPPPTARATGACAHRTSR